MATSLSISDTSDNEGVDFSAIDFETIEGFGDETIPQFGIKRPRSQSASISSRDRISLLDDKSGSDVKRVKHNSVSSQDRTSSPCSILKTEIDLKVHVCKECGVQFTNSFFQKKLCLEICNDCKEKEEYKLITATEARQKYHLTDRHMRDEATGKLACIEKKNPFNSGWSRMKLYLESQVKDKAYAVWGGEEGIEKESKRRRELSHKIKRNKYAKELKEMRVSAKIASATFRSPFHEHSYGNEEQINADMEEYQKTCTICGFVLKYEKL